jgi:hypothetical protein
VAGQAGVVVVVAAPLVVVVVEVAGGASSFICHHATKLHVLYAWLPLGLGIIRVCGVRHLLGAVLVVGDTCLLISYSSWMICWCWRLQCQLLKVAIAVGHTAMSSAKQSMTD